MANIKATFEEATSDGGRTTLAGKLMPFLSNFALSPDDVATIYNNLARTVDFREFTLISFIAWGVMPVFETLAWVWQSVFGKRDAKDFKNFYLYGVVESISQAAMVGVFIYAADCVVVIMNALGFEYLERVGFSEKAANVSFFAWVCKRIMHFKRILIYRKIKPDNRAYMYNKILNVVLTILAVIVIIDRLDLDFDITLSSIFAVGGVGTLVLSLASKDIAAQLVNGIAVATSKRFFVGDEIILGDGTQGIVSSVGLIYTEIRGSDEITIKIPNSQVVNERISNLSQRRTSRVKQTLRFYYEDLKNLPKVIASIRYEILKACPALITDDVSRPFSVHWTEFESDHLVVAVECHFTIPPSDSNKQTVLEAIARGVEQHNVKFAIPNSISKNMDLKQ